MKGTIKSKEEISWLFGNGSKFSCAAFLALYHPRQTKSGVELLSDDESYLDNVEAQPNTSQRRLMGNSQGRLAFAAGKKLGNAPERNRAKRRLRAAARLAGAPWCNYDVVLVARSGALQGSHATLVANLERLGEQLAGGPIIPGCPPNNHFASERRVCIGATAPGRPLTADLPIKQQALVDSTPNHPSATPPITPQTFIIGIPRNIALKCINIYRHAISPLLPPSCRYVPTCSEYATIALQRFGFWKGLWLAARRVGRCHPFAKGGYDPVPQVWTR